jgi:DnaK suppressor protein
LLNKQSGKGVQMIKRKILENVRWLLVLQMEYLQGTASRAAVRMKDEPGNLADVADQAAAEHDRNLEWIIRARESHQIREIQEAILRIDRGQFGICVRCGEAISQKRLLLTPITRLCTVCKEKMEPHRHRRSGFGSGYSVGENHVA